MIIQSLNPFEIRLNNYNRALKVFWKANEIKSSEWSTIDWR